MAKTFTEKGKGKDKDEWNLFPTVTYRHVLTQSTGVQ